MRLIRKLLVEAKKNATSSSLHLPYHAGYLMPGRWIQVSSTNETWRHVDAELPTALAEEVEAASTTHPGWAYGSSLWKRAKRSVFRSAVGVARLSWYVKSRGQIMPPPVEPRRGNATVVRRTGDNRADLIAFEQRKERVFRLGQPGSYDSEYVEVRRRYEGYFPTPGFAVRDEGAVLVEEWCKGRVLKNLNRKTRVTVILDVLERYAALVASEQQPGDGTPWQGIPKLLGEVTVPTPLQHLLTDIQVQCLLNSLLLVPSHVGGVGPRDIIVDQRDGGYWIVDLDKARWAPVWFDPIVIACTAVNYADGVDKQALQQIGAALDKIWVAAGLSEAVGLNARHWFALMVIRGAFWKAGRTKHTSVAGGFAEPDADDFTYRFAAIASKNYKKWEGKLPSPTR